jgi:hypothetical protein
MVFYGNFFLLMNFYFVLSVMICIFYNSIPSPHFLDHLSEIRNGEGEAKVKNAVSPFLHEERVDFGISIHLSFNDKFTLTKCIPEYNLYVKIINRI